MTRLNQQIFNVSVYTHSELNIKFITIFLCYSCSFCFFVIYLLTLIEFCHLWIYGSRDREQSKVYKTKIKRAVLFDEGKHARPSVTALRSTHCRNEWKNLPKQNVNACVTHLMTFQYMYVFFHWKFHFGCIFVLLWTRKNDDKNNRRKKGTKSFVLFIGRWSTRYWTNTVMFRPHPFPLPKPCLLDNIAYININSWDAIKQFFYIDEHWTTTRRMPSWFVCLFDALFVLQLIFSSHHLHIAASFLV